MRQDIREAIDAVRRELNMHPSAHDDEKREVETARGEIDRSVQDDDETTLNETLTRLEARLETENPRLMDGIRKALHILNNAGV